jgi:hypothetical protein
MVSTPLHPKKNAIMNRFFTLGLVSIFFYSTATAQDNTEVDKRHDPKMNNYLSPNTNFRINPDKNPAIHPKFNWNINPHKNLLINPDKVALINPIKNTELNPTSHQDMNPMYVMNLSPKFITWQGQYVFDKADKHIGFITYINQSLMVEFDKTANWNFFYIKTGRDTYNQFDLDGKWTGNYFCSDELMGYNLFNTKDEWTGVHVK